MPNKGGYDMINQDKKMCPICHKYIDGYEMYCDCGYEFGSNHCTNPNCRKVCGDFTSFCSECGCETENYLNGDIGCAVPTNVS